MADADARRVLLVADGASPHTRRLAAALIQRGLDVRLACFEHSPVQGVTVSMLGRQPASQDLRYLSGLVPLARLIRRIQPAIIHAHYVSSYGLMAALAGYLAHPVGGRPKVIQTAWGTDLLVTARSSRWRRLAARYALRSADLITGDSADLEQAALDLAPSVPYRRFVFGPAAHLFDAQAAKGPIMISTRRLDPDTRVDRIVTAFRMATSSDPDPLVGWRLIVAGAGVTEDRVREAAGGDPRVELVGQLDAAELAKLLGSASVAVSIPVSDASSAALLEAMAAGVLPIVNDLPANREWVDAATGEFVPRDPDAASLAAAMVRAAKREPDVDSIRGRVRNVAWDDEIERLVDAYRTLRA